MMADDPSRDNIARRRVPEYKTHFLRGDSQEKRREKALEEQKRKRAERVESSRNIDLFAGLTLGSPKISTVSVEEDEDEEDAPTIPYSGLAQFAALLPPEPQQEPALALPISFGSTSSKHSRPKPTRFKGKRRQRNTPQDPGSPVQPNPLANAIMYAELLEMNSDLINWHMGPQGFAGVEDGLPRDLETAWVALAPVPRGKRCMAVAYQIVGGNKDGPRSKTQLHSRVKGTPFLTFPSPLPPDTILDCILDTEWQQNGILHVVDILRWRGSDFTDCETEFRFWWRDARLSELHSMNISSPRPISQATSPSEPQPLFAHPTTFLSVPYHPSPLPNSTLLQNIIPAGRAGRQISIQVPIPKPPRRRPKDRSVTPEANGDMDLDSKSGTATPFDPSKPGEETLDEFGRSDPETMSRIHLQPPAKSSPSPRTRTELISIVSDGILLYVSQASYHSGESPLTCWIPSAPYVPNTAPQIESGDLQNLNASSPLDLFDSLIRRRCALNNINGMPAPTAGGSLTDTNTMET